MPDGGMHYPALVLNADFRPLSYFPLSVWAWQDAVKAVFLDRVCVLNEYEVAVHSPSLSMRLPSVIALKEYIPAARRPAFTRFNVFLRDAFACQYCNERLPTHDLTFDHVVPRSRGGRTTWSATCTRAKRRGSRRRGSCRRTAALSRRTTCTRVGGTTSIGTPNCSKAEPGAPAHARDQILVSPRGTTARVNHV